MNDALQLNYESLDLFRSLGEAVSEADSLSNIAWQLMERGNYEPVQPMLQEALAIHTRANYPAGIARTKIYLGDILWRNNDSGRGYPLPGRRYKLAPAGQPPDSVTRRPLQAWVSLSLPGERPWLKRRSLKMSKFRRK